MLKLSRFLIPESSKHCWKEMVWEMLKKITIKEGTEDARLEGLQQDNAENKRPRNEIGVLEAERNREP